MKRITLNKNDTFRAIGLIMIIISLMYLSNYAIDEAVAVIGHNSGKNLPIYSVETDQKVVAISFDAAWGNEDTEDILNILDTYNVKATFFLVASWVDKFPEDIKEMYARGHDIGNHSTTHSHMTQQSTDACKQELMTAHQKVFDLIGVNMDLFRPPYGDYDAKVVDAARDCGYYTIQWDVDSLDWKEYGTAHEIKTVLQNKNLGNGSIILFHNNTSYTPEALPAIIEGLQEMGYRLVPISELIIREDYRIDHTGRQFSVEEGHKKMN